MRDVEPEKEFPNSSNKCNARRKTGTHINPEEKEKNSSLSLWQG